MARNLANKPRTDNEDRELGEYLKKIDGMKYRRVNDNLRGWDDGIQKIKKNYS